MCQDVNRVFKINQRVEAVARGVFDAVFVANARCQRFIGTGNASHVLQLVQQGGVALAKTRHAEQVFGIKHRAIAQHHA